MPQEKFHYKSLEEVKQRAAELGVDLPFAADTHALAQPLTVRNITFPNRLGIAPMEGADSTPEGAPTEYTTRRYVNEAIGGSSVIWFEAISIVEEGRSSQTQLLLNRDTLDEFKKMTTAVKEAGLKANGYAPYLIMQANHSGRYSNPGNKPAPMIAYRHPILEQYRAADDSCIVSDDYLKGLEVKFGEATKTAAAGGGSCEAIEPDAFGTQSRAQCGKLFPYQSRQRTAVQVNDLAFQWCCLARARRSGHVARGVDPEGACGDVVRFVD